MSSTGSGTRGDELVDDHAQPRHGAREIVVRVEARGGEVTLGQLPRAHRRSVGRGPPVERAQLVELGAVAAPVDEGVEPEAREELRELGRVPERVGHVADGRHRTERAGHLPSRSAGCGRASRPRAGASRAARTTGPPRAAPRADPRRARRAGPGAPRGSPPAPRPGRRARSGNPGSAARRSSTPSTASTRRPRNTSKRSVPLAVPVEVGDEQDLGCQRVKPRRRSCRGRRVSRLRRAGARPR